MSNDWEKGQDLRDAVMEAQSEAYNRYHAQKHKVLDHVTSGTIMTDMCYDIAAELSAMLEHHTHAKVHEVLLTNSNSSFATLHDILGNLTSVLDQVQEQMKADGHLWAASITEEIKTGFGQWHARAEKIDPTVADRPSPDPFRAKEG